VRRVLDRLGRLDRAVYVERASLPLGRVLPFACIGPGDASYFSTILLPAGSTEG
jgi:precorrin-2 methylase